MMSSPNTLIECLKVVSMVGKAQGMGHSQNKGLVLEARRVHEGDPNEEYSIPRALGHIKPGSHLITGQLLSKSGTK
jgi:hypothetical protein